MLKLNFAYSLLLGIVTPCGLASIQVPLDPQRYHPSVEQKLRIDNGVEPKELDPSTSTGVSESHIIDNLFEGLTSEDAYTLEPTPGVAESWKISTDGKVYTFKLRKNAQWSDGKALTASDFVWSWQHTLNPATASEYAYQLHYIKNGEAYNTGKLKDASQLGVKALDPTTLQVTLERPTPFFLRLTSFHTLFPIPRHVVEKYPDKVWTQAGKMVSNGPFMLSEWKLNQHIKAVPNPHYWDKDKVKLKEVTFFPIEKDSTSEKTFLAGDLHMTLQVPSAKVESYKKEIAKNPGVYHPYKVHPYMGSYYYRFNVTRKPLNDVRVRRALALTVDRKLLVERILHGGQQPLTSFTPPNTGGYTYTGSTLPATVTAKEIAEAKKLLAAAGYPDGKGLPPIQILYNTAEDHKKIAVAIQEMWRENLGVKVELINQEWKVYLDSQRKLDYFLSRAGWIGDYPDPNTFLDMFVTNGGNNQTGWSNKRYDELIDEAANTVDQKKRFAAFHEAEKILLDELPVLPVYVYTKQNLVSKNLKMINDRGQLTEWMGNITDRWSLKNYVLVDEAPVKR